MVHNGTYLELPTTRSLWCWKKKSVLGPVWLAESWVIPTHRFESESKNTFLRLWQCLLCAGSVMLSLFLLTDSHCVCKLCSFWWSNLAKHREGSCLGLWREDGPENQSSFFFSACWAQSECWSFRPSAHPGWPEGKGKGRGKQQKEGSRVEGEKGAKVLQMETRV